MSDFDKVRTPDDPALTRATARQLFAEWDAAGMRSFVGQYLPGGTVDPADLWAELAIGTRLARVVTCGRWCVVASLLRGGEITSWSDVGDALGMTEIEARDGFHGWIDGQAALRRTSLIGLTEDQAEELYRLSEAVAW